MRTMRWAMLSVLVAVIALAPSQTEAGVRGNRFSGTFTNNVDRTADFTCDFFPNGSFTETEDFGNGPFPFTGTYTEL
ncbi:MAG: hypothetical protein B7Z55_16855, partial [Planctomycetales bacterium 12-60-4]